MKVLITGGFGFLGGRLAKYLNEIPGYEILLGTRNIKNQATSLQQFIAIETNWESDASIRNSCVGVDTIIHLSGMDANSCHADPINALNINGLRAAKLLRTAIDSGVQQFIYFSTAHVYDSPLKGLINENNCTRSLHPYATSNRAGEDVVLAQVENAKINGTILRLSNSYGAPVNPNANCWSLLVNDLCKQAVVSREMILRSNGLQRRDFITINDVCRATEHLMRFRFTKDESYRSIFNVGGSWAPSLWEMAEFIQNRCVKTLGYKPELIRIPPQKDDFSIPLDFNIDKLLSTDFILEDNRVGEIDELLRYCNRIFG